MRSMICYRKVTVERAMESTGSDFAAHGEKDHVVQAAEILGLSNQSMRRWRERYEEFSYDGLFDRRQGKPSPKRAAVVGQVLGLYRDRYFDLNVRHFREKLRSEHGIQLNYAWASLTLVARHPPSTSP